MMIARFVFLLVLYCFSLKYKSTALMAVSLFQETDKSAEVPADKSKDELWRHFGFWPMRIDLASFNFS